MTPAQLDHLKRLDAHLDALLALASKRTPGEWMTPHLSRDEVTCNCAYVLSEYYCGAICTIHTSDGKSVSEGGSDDPIESEAKANGFFIAACAGRAEAGWRATKAAIAAILNCQANSFPHMYAALQVEQMAEAILAAWPIETLTLP